MGSGCTASRGSNTVPSIERSKVANEEGKQEPAVVSVVSYDAGETANNVETEKAEEAAQASEIWRCIEEGDQDTLRRIISQVELSSVELFNAKGQSVLHHAAAYGNTAAISMIIDANIPTITPDLLNSKLATPLHSAVAHDKPESVSGLIGYGADPNIEDENGQTPLLLCTVLGRKEILRVLIESSNSGKLSEPLNINSKDRKGLCPLNCCAIKGELEMCKLLVEEGKASVDELSPKSCTALIYGARGGYDKIVELLLAHKANKQHQDQSGATALHHACEKNMHECVKVLVSSQADSEIQDMLGRTPLFEAVLNSSLESLEELLKHGVDVNAIDHLGRTPLFYAAKEGQEEIVQVLVEEGKADVNAYSMPNPAVEKEMLAMRKKEGLSRLQLHALNTSRTPLHAVAASVGGDGKLIEYLMGKGARILEPGRHNNTALHIAAFAGNIVAAKVLIKNGIDVTLKNSNGQVAMDIVSKYYPSYLAELTSESWRQPKKEIMVIEGEYEEEREEELSIVSEAPYTEDPRVSAVSSIFGDKVGAAIQSADKRYKGLKYILNNTAGKELTSDLLNVLLGVVTLALEERAFKMNQIGLQLLDGLLADGAASITNSLVEDHGVIDLLFFRASSSTEKLFNRIIDVIPKIGDLPGVGIEYLVMKCMNSLIKSLGPESEELPASKKYKTVNVMLQVILKVIDAFGPDPWPAKDLEAMLSSVSHKTVSASIQQLMTILRESNMVKIIEAKAEVLATKKAGGVEEHVLALQGEVERTSELTTEEEWEELGKHLQNVLKERNITNYLAGVNICNLFLAKVLEYRREFLELHFLEIMQPVLGKIDSVNKRVKSKCRGLVILLWKESIQNKDWLHMHMATHLTSPEQHKVFAGAMEVFDDILAYCAEQSLIFSGYKAVEDAIGVELETLIRLAANELGHKAVNIRNISTNLLIKCSDIVASLGGSSQHEKLVATLEAALKPVSQNIRERVLELLNKDVTAVIKKRREEKSGSPEKAAAEEEKGGLIYAEPLSEELRTQLAPMLKYFSERVVLSMYSQNWSARFQGLLKIKEELVFITIGATTAVLDRKSESKDCSQRNVNIGNISIIKSIDIWLAMLKHVLDDPVIKIYIEGVDLVKDVVTVMRKHVLNGDEVMRMVDPLVVQILEKLNDQKPKIREKSIDLLIAMLKDELIQPFYVSEKVMGKFEDTKGAVSANQLGGLLKVIIECVGVYKMSAGNQKMLSAYMQLLNMSLRHQLPSVRSQAEQLYVSLHALHGAQINNYLVNQKGAILKKLQSLVAAGDPKSESGKKEESPGKQASSGITTLRNLVESGSDSLLNSEDPQQRIKGLVGVKKYLVKIISTKEMSSDRAHEILDELSMLMRTVLNDTNPEVYMEALKLLKYALNQFLKKLTSFDLQITVNSIISILIPKTISSAHHKIQIATDKFICALGKESLIGPVVIIKNVFRSVDKLASECVAYAKSFRMSSSQHGFNKTGTLAFDPSQNMAAVMRYLGVATIVLAHYRTVIAHSKEAIECFCDTIMNLCNAYGDKVQIKECLYPISKEILSIDSKAFEATLGKRDGEQKVRINEVLKASREILDEEFASGMKMGEKRRMQGSKGFVPDTSSVSTLPSVYPSSSTQGFHQSKTLEEQKKVLPSYAKRVGKAPEGTKPILPPIVSASQQLPPLVLHKNPGEARRETPQKPMWLGREEEKQLSLTNTGFQPVVSVKSKKLPGEEEENDDPIKRKAYSSHPFRFLN